MDKVMLVFICPHIFFENTKTVPSCDLLKSEFTEKQKTLTEFFMWDCFCWALKQTVNLNVQMFVVMLFLYLTSCVSCTDLRWQQPAALSLSVFSIFCPVCFCSCCPSLTLLLAEGRWVKGRRVSHQQPSDMEPQRAALGAVFLLTLLSTGEFLKLTSVFLLSRCWS